MICIKRQKDGHQKVQQKKGNDFTILNLDTLSKFNRILKGILYMLYEIGAQKLSIICIVFLIHKNKIEKTLLQTFE